MSPIKGGSLRGKCFPDDGPEVDSENAKDTGKNGWCRNGEFDSGKNKTDEETGNESQEWIFANGDEVVHGV